ncbi:hypothetical protein BJV74DRAFT_799332 [Russula compacta]|nr:hypothetical protein BJV74DRAFT_799332 [Russula compacta]
MFRVAFGFYKGNTTLAPNNGSKIIDHCCNIAWRLFVDVEDAHYTEDNVVKLGNAVKNWVNSLKAVYTKNRAKLSETGQGLLDIDQEDEITPSSEITNIWGDQLLVAYKIKAVFPWYKHLHALMRTNPTITKASVAHSKTPLDLGILVQGGSGLVY